MLVLKLKEPRNEDAKITIIVYNLLHVVIMQIFIKMFI